MTTAQMVAEVRTKLDESSSGFWSDTEIYRALNNGQITTVSKLHSQKKTHYLSELKSRKTGTSSDLTLPTDFWQYISCDVDSDGCLLRTGDRWIKENNYYLTGETKQKYIYLDGGSIEFSPTINGIYRFEYYKKPTEVSSTAEPILDDRIHPSIVQYAYSQLLLKDEKHEQSLLELQKYDKMVAEL